MAAQAVPTAERLRGRRRDVTIDAAVLSAAAELLEETGYPRLSIAAIAERANVHKPALYRRWRSKPELVVEVLAATLPEAHFTDTGSLRGDLAAGLQTLRLTWSRPRNRQTLLALLADLMEDPEAHDAFQRRLIGRGSASFRAAVERARLRGEVTGHVSPETLSALLEGPLVHRIVLAEQAIDDELIDSVLTAVCAVAAGS